MTNENSTGWTTVREAADLLGITPQGIRASYIPSLTDSDIRRGKPLRVRFVAIVDILTARRVAELAREAANGDQLLAGDSPALERYRLAKAKHAELDLENRRGQLIDRTKCREVLGRWAAILRRTGEVLSSRYGNDTAEEMNDALKECAIVVNDLRPNGAADAE